MSATSLENTFRFLKRRVLAIGGASGVAWGCCAAIGLLLAGVWLDLVWELSAGARIAALGLAVMVGLALAVRFIANAVSRARERVLARRLDETGKTGGQIVSGFELQMSGGGTSQSAAAPSMTRALAELAIARAASLAAHIPTTLAVPSKPVRQAAIGAGALVVGLGLVFVAAPRLASTEWLRFADPFGDHPPFSRTVLHVEPGDTKVRYGDGLEVAVATEGPPVEQLELVLRTGADGTGGNAAREETLPMFPESQGRWRASVSSVTSPESFLSNAPS